MTKPKRTTRGTTEAPAKKQRRVRVKTGQLVAVPLQDGTYALLHVALYDGDVIGAHYPHRKSAPEQLIEGLEEAMHRGPIAVLAITSNRVQDGHWPVIGHKDPAYPAKLLDTRGTSHTAGVTPNLFEAYFGLRPWDEMHDPRWYEKVLLPGVPVPSTVRYRRDFESDTTVHSVTVAAAPNHGDGSPAVMTGPAEVHIEIRYPGTDLPSLDLLHRRQELERALESAGAGEVTDAGAGGGILDIFLMTPDVQTSMPLIRSAVKAAGFEKDAKIEANALDDANDGDAS